ncbi:helix-turn-helix domain-containing protein [Aeromicrobium sp.]|uniref:MarR family transcriptional regulator n=1 Tax=Aeromicrobium sp. TaxID=1871063 RepID=UPI0019AE86B7|nr:helix-turn-helix domain-containing protein [Aeromicrobium sp.]MBC7630263.1 MarR family transcriptional regulator [Aeromicrobium sp.]
MLVAAGFDVSVRPDQRRGVDLLVSRDGETVVVQVKVRQKTIYEWDALRLLENTGEHVLVVVPIASRGLIDAAKKDGRLGVVSLRNRLLIWNREEIQSPDAIAESRASLAVPNRRRNPWGRWAIMRVYILNGEPRSQAELAKETGVTQSAVSKSNSALDGLVVRSASGWRAPDRLALWDAFMAEYAGPGGITTNWYGLDAVTHQSNSVVAAGASAGVQVLVSGDSAADQLAPWRVPARAAVYAASGIALGKLGFAQTTDERATLTFTVPADRTIWATAASWSQRRNTSTVDPVIAAWDVRRTGGPDADEAVKRIRNLVLTSERS